jgi:hypothetical protein
VLVLILYLLRGTVVPGAVALAGLR